MTASPGEKPAPGAHRCRRVALRAGGQRDRVGALHRRRFAVAERRHAREPGADGRVGVEHRRARRGAAHEPDRLRRREVGDRRSAAEQEAPAVGEHRLDPPQVRGERGGAVVRRRAPQRRRHRRAIRAERLQVLGRRAGEDVRRADLHRVGDGRPEERRVGPLGDGLGQAGALARVERRLRREAIDDAAHQERVAVDVGADLHERRAPVAAGQRDDVGLGHDPRHRHRAPRQPLHAEDEAHLLGERRRAVVMEDEIAHAGSCCAGR